MTQGTDPNDPDDFLDSDGDGVPDSVEVADGTDPNDAAAHGQAGRPRHCTFGYTGIYTTTATRAEITRLHLAYFRRLTEVGGLDYWTTQVDGGLALRDLRRLFAASVEFNDRHATTGDADFATLAYDTLLCRPSPTPGVRRIGRRCSRREH